MPDGTK